MHLVSCSHCGVVIDVAVLKFAEDIWTEDCSIDPALAKYDSDRGEHVAYVKCPVCTSDVFKPQ